MRATTVERLICPSRSDRSLQGCGGDLTLEARERDGEEIRTGSLTCSNCGSEYPILAGVAIVVPHVADYLFEHVKGISRYVSDREIPKEFQSEYLEAKAQIVREHIEDDLEAERVNALYLMNHYLSAHGQNWWKPIGGTPDPLIDRLIVDHWDRAPLSRIAEALGATPEARGSELVELGCGVGGLGVRVGASLRGYLGIDSSFASIAMARHLALGIPSREKVMIPEDLLRGVVSREVEISPPERSTAHLDYVVGDAVFPPLRDGDWDLTASLNMIDMLDEPEALPALQHRLLKTGGIAIQSCPYIWHPATAEHLLELVPNARDSASAVSELYRRAGFEITREEDRIPWLFFKHVRQLELYSVHFLMGRRKE